MNKRIFLSFLLSIFLLSVMFRTSFVGQVKAQTVPIVSITFSNGTNSSQYEYGLGNTFRVNITVDSPDITVWSWQVGIHYNSTILECTGLGDGTFFNGRYVLGFQSGIIHNDLGYVTISGNSLRLPETTGVTGSGVLMWFQFNVKKGGLCLLDLTLSPPDLVCGTKLNEKVGNSIVPISPIVLYDGLIECMPFFIMGPYYTWWGAEYWIVELRKHPIRLISKY